jgi:peptidylprolyl isomerase
MGTNTKVILGMVLLVAIIVTASIFSKKNNPNQNVNDMSLVAEISPETSLPSQNETTPLSTNQATTSMESEKTITTAILKTSMGDITIALDNESTPKTVENFFTLAQSGFYNGTKFHRIIADFMIQAGDPLTKDDTMMDRWGTGGPGYQFADEIKPTNKNLKGTLSMANAGPNTNGSQFFINVVDNPHLDRGHTVFGKVTAGYDVAEKMSKVATLPNGRPVEPVILYSVELQ